MSDDNSQGVSFFRRFIVFTLLVSLFAFVALAAVLYVIAEFFGTAGYIAIGIMAFIAMWAVTHEHAVEAEYNIRHRIEIEESKAQQKIRELEDELLRLKSCEDDRKRKT